MRGRRIALAVAVCMAMASVATSAKVTLTYWEKWSGFEGEIIRGIVDKYNKSQKQIEVKYVLVDGDINQKYLTACAAGTPPDLVGLWNHRMAPFVKAGVVQPLDQYLKVLGKGKKDFIPSYWDMMTFEGKTYGVPITSASFVFYWNKGTFAEAGLNPEAPPKTMEQIMELNDKLTKKSADGRYTQIGYSPAHPGWWPYLWPVFFGADLFNESKKTVDLTQPGMVKGYEWVSQLSKRLGVQNIGKMNMGDYRSKSGPFFSGKMAMDIQGSWQPSFLLKMAPGIKYGIESLPSGQGGSEWAWLEADVVFLPKAGRRNKDAASFLGYLISPAVQQEFNLKRETFSPVQAALTPEFVKQNKNPNIRELVDIATSKRGMFTPKTPAWADLDAQVYNPVFWDVWNGKKAPAQALNDVSKLAAAICQRKAK